MSPAFQHFNDLEASRYEELKRDISERGVLIPILTDEDGNVIDGHQRRRICAELHADCPSVVVPDLTEDEKHQLAIVLNLYRRQLSGTERSKVIGELARMRLSTRRIGAILGVSHTTVLRNLPESGGADAPPVIGADGKEYPPTKPPRATGSSDQSHAPLADADGVPTGGEGREDEGGSDDAPATDEGAADPTTAPAPSEPTPEQAAAKYRSFIDSTLVRLDDVLRMDAGRVTEVATNEQRQNVLASVALTRDWCDRMEAAIQSRPNLKAV